jgi:hypothetical protein
LEVESAAGGKRAARLASGLIFGLIRLVEFGLVVFGLVNGDTEVTISAFGVS